MRDLLDFWFLDCLDCGLDLILDCGKVFGKVFGRLFEKVLFENICCVLLFFILPLFVKSIVQLTRLYPFFA